MKSRRHFGNNVEKRQKKCLGSCSTRASTRAGYFSKKDEIKWKKKKSTNKEKIKPWRSWFEFARCKTLFPWTILVLWKPVFKVHPQTTSAYLDAGVATVTLSCEADGFPRPVISWLENNSSVTNATVIQNGSISTLVVVFSEARDQTYQCVANNSEGKALSKKAKVTILERATRLPGKSYTPMSSQRQILEKKNHILMLNYFITLLI